MAKVIKQFEDRETKKIYTVGSEYTGTPERIKELTEKGRLGTDNDSTSKKKKKDEV